MEGKENKPENLVDTQTSTNEQIEPLELINSLALSDAKSLYDISKFQNDEEVKKIKRKTKKPLKEINEIADSKIDTEQKLAQIFDKFQKLISDTKKNHEDFSSSRKNLAQIVSDRDALITENGKLRNTNLSLDGLYKDLQKQNQILLDEHKKLQADEKSIRMKLAEDFQTRINETSTNLETHARDHHQKSKENELLKAKLQEVEEKFQQREAIFADELKKRESQMTSHYSDVESRFKTIEDEANKEDEYSKELDEAKLAEQKIQEKLNLLTEKSDTFQTVMTNANEFFAVVKKEMDKMGNKIKALDNENTTLQKKSEKADIAAFELIEEYSKWSKEIEKSESQKEGLNKIIEKQEKELAELTQKLTQ